MTVEELKPIIESLIYVSEEPIGLKQLGVILEGESADDIEAHTPEMDAFLLALTHELSAFAARATPLIPADDQDRAPPPVSGTSSDRGDTDRKSTRLNSSH